MIVFDYIKRYFAIKKDGVSDHLCIIKVPVRNTECSDVHSNNIGLNLGIIKLPEGFKPLVVVQEKL